MIILISIISGKAVKWYNQSWGALKLPVPSYCTKWVCHAFLIIIIPSPVTWLHPTSSGGSGTHMTKKGWAENTTQYRNEVVTRFPVGVREKTIQGYVAVQFFILKNASNLTCELNIGTCNHSAFKKLLPNWILLFSYKIIEALLHRLLGLFWDGWEASCQTVFN